MKAGCRQGERSGQRTGRQLSMQTRFRGAGLNYRAGCLVFRTGVLIPLNGQFGAKRPHGQVLRVFQSHGHAENRTTILLSLQSVTAGSSCFVVLNIHRNLLRFIKDGEKMVGRGVEGGGCGGRIPIDKFARSKTFSETPKRPTTTNNNRSTGDVELAAAE